MRLSHPDGESDLFGIEGERDGSVRVYVRTSVRMTRGSKQGLLFAQELYRGQVNKLLPSIDRRTSW